MFDRSTRYGLTWRPEISPVWPDYRPSCTIGPVSGVIGTGGQIFPSREAIEAGTVAALTIKLADVEAERDKLKARLDERFDITRPIDIRQDALLAMNVLDRFADDQGPFTRTDAGRMVGAIRRLLGGYDDAKRQARHDRDHAGKLVARNRVIADLTTERDSLRDMVERKSDRIVDLEADRDASRLSAIHYREALVDVRADLHNDNGLNLLSIADTIWHGPAETTVDFIDATLEAIPTDKARCRVVTSPRFYSDEDHQRAADELSRLILNSTRTGDLGRRCKDYVTTVASALGMRRAKA